MKYITTSPLFILFIFCFPIFGKAQIHPDDSLQLVNLYNAVCNDGCTLNWDLEEPSTWSGITFSNGRVENIYLQNENLKGALPNIDLPKLRYFNVANNQMTGNLPDFDQCDSLRLFHISVNGFTGALPLFENCSELKEISAHLNNLTDIIPDYNLSNLTSLSLWKNDLISPIPYLEGCPNLSYLALEHNNFADTIPNFNLPNLKILTLGNNELIGNIPNFNQCDSLRELSIGVNNLTGTLPTFENCQELKTISAHLNNLTGVIPNYNLPNLTSLGLWQNDLISPIPYLEDCPNLSYLALEHNNFTDTIPNFNLPNLKTLTLGSNELIGNIPNFNQCDSLRQLSMGVNKLTGELPTFENCQKLETVSAHLNDLEGSIPDYNLLNLKSLSLWHNDLSGIVPDIYGNNPQISYFSIQHNNFSYDDIAFNFGSNFLINVFVYDPQNGIQYDLETDSLQLVKLYIKTNGENWTNTWDLTQPMDSWYGISINSSGNVAAIDLKNNNLTGSLPNLNLPDMWRIAVENNFIGGAIPDFAGCEGLSRINLHENEFTGNVPNFDLPNLKYLILHHNNLSDSLPDFQGCPELIDIWLNHNDLSGQLPDFSNSPNLALLYAYANDLSGEIPAFDNHTNLSNLALGGNNLTGAIPDFANCQRLSRLNLESNSLSGAIPDFDLPELKYLILNNNNLSGTVPSFNSCISLIDVWLNNNNLSGNLPDFANSTNLALLYAYTNDLSGEIPAFDNHTNLSNLALGGNNLTGTIPDFANCQRLSRLNLESNNLSGTIPDFDLPELKYLILHNNDLSGITPSFDSCFALIDIWLNHNDLSGQLPDFSNSPNLALIHAFGNNLTGTIPDYSNHVNLGKLHIDYNQFSHEDIATNYDANNNSIDIFNFDIQYYGNEQFRTDTIVGDIVVLSPSPSIPYDNPKVVWRKDGVYLNFPYTLHDTTYVIENMDTTDIGVYNYWFKDETLTPLVEFRSRPINNQIKGLDLDGEPVLAGELIVEFGEDMTDELIATKREVLENDFNGVLLGSCGCHKEIDLWRFDSAADVDAVRSFLNGKVEQRSSDTESDGGPNRSNILTPSYLNDQKLIVSNPDGGTGTGEEIVIAVIDTGVLPNHVSIQSALKVNENEIPDDGEDNDHNGYVDDIYGIDIVDSLAMSDPNGHGTFVAGTITANIPAGHNIKVMLARAFNENGRGELFDVICSIYYAADNGADIINMSANYKGEMSKALKNAVQYAGTQGILFVSSSGNDTTNLHQAEVKNWPASLTAVEGINNVITVTALNNQGELLEGANYGSEIVAIATLGEGIYAPSNGHSEDYNYITGTSVSAPLVALSLGIEKSKDPNRPPEQLKNDFLNSQRVESVPELLPYVKGGRKLNIEKSEVNIDNFSITVLLEGAMLEVNGNNLLLPMRTDLNQKNLLPGQPFTGVGVPTPPGHPYRDSIFCYYGNEGNNVSYPPDVVDWVMVSLRKEVDTLEIYRTVGLLRDNGDVTFLQPIAGLVDVPESVYVVVEHRNHLGVMSHQKVPIMNRTITYDFTQQDSYTAAGGFGQLQAPIGVWHMIGSNGVHENEVAGEVNGQDIGIWFNNNGKFNIYTSADYNMDGDTNGADKTLWEQHNGKSNRVETLDCSEKSSGN